VHLDVKGRTRPNNRNNQLNKGFGHRNASFQMKKREAFLTKQYDTYKSNITHFIIKPHTHFNIKEQQESLEAKNRNHYNPTFWNDKGAVQYTTNCYAYALNISTLPVEVFRMTGGLLHPGSLAGKDLNFYDLEPSQIVEYAKLDAKALGGLFIEATSGMQCPKDAWRVALVCSSEGDYHWYREHKDGTWSHKRGRTDVTNKDAVNKIIKDPKICDRHYGIIRYNQFVGYFYVKTKKG
jgi:hypothetical protein